MTDETEITLQHADWEAVVSSHGASLRGVTYRTQPVVTGYRGTPNKQGGQGDVLIPFPGRVAKGRYTWDGVEYQLPLTDKDGPNAIHGFVRKADWTLVERHPSSATYELRFAGADGYPFPLDIRLTYALSADGLTCDCAITNTGAHDAPVSMGFHPYFAVGSELVDSDVLTLPFSQVLEFERLIPTGRVDDVAQTALDFRLPRAIAQTAFNHCFMAPVRDADGCARITLASEVRALTVWMDRAFSAVVLYTGDNLAPKIARGSIAIEPMSSASDALNHPEWGLKRLEPKATLRGAWGVSVR
jgi:aldose 1-epimerase